MFSKLKSFIISMDYLFANVFLYSQSRAYEVLKDCVYAKVRRLKKEFNLENGSVNKSLSINEKELSIRNRSNSEFAQYSSGYTIEQIPREFVEIISNVFVCSIPIASLLFNVFPSIIISPSINII